MNQNVSNFSLFQTYMHFHIASATYEPQNHIVVKQFGTESIPLISEHLVFNFEVSSRSIV